MNKNDMQRDADRLIAQGIDPDSVYTYTLEEYAAMHGDEVDTFDELKEDINQCKWKIDECTAEIEDLTAEIDELNQKIAEYDKNIEEYEERKKETRNYMEGIEIDEWIKEEEKEREKVIYSRNQKQERLDKVKKQRDELAQELARLKAKLEAMFHTEEKTEDTEGTPVEEDEYDEQMTLEEELAAIEAAEDALEEKTLEIDGYAFEMHCLEQDVKNINSEIAKLVEIRRRKLAEYEAAKQNKEKATLEYTELEEKRRRF